MAIIVGSRQVRDKVVFKVEADMSESLNLKGNLRNVIMFPLDTCDIDSQIIEKGREGATKHFLLPMSLRKKNKGRPNNISYQAHDMNEKAVFIFSLEYGDKDCKTNIRPQDSY